MIHAAVIALALLTAGPAVAADDGIPGLPAGTVFGHEATERPRQILAAESKGGRQSQLVALGNTAFSAPSLFGEKARIAGLACDTCHRQGDINQRFFIPGVSARPGGIDPTTAMFNPIQDDGVANHVDIPSLRGIRQFGPYGRDGRTASLREFIRNVIVLEFGGQEPSAHILDALVAYLEQIELLPNPKVDSLGRLTKAAGTAAQRGEMLFRKPMAGMGGLACAGCHLPEAGFVDKLVHDVGSDGRFRTPTLLNARFTAPYFHDGRYATLGAVVEHFNRTFQLGLEAEEKRDLVAYLEAVGDGVDPFEPVTRQNEMSELASYVAVLDQAIPGGDQLAIDLVVDTVQVTLDRIAVRFDNRDKRTGRPRRPDRPDVARIAATLRADMGETGTHVAPGDKDAAAAALKRYREHATELVAAYPQGS